MKQEGMFQLTDKVAVVTGAGRGIGQAIALTFARAGAKVAVVSRTESNSAATAALINAERPDAARPYAVDVADSAAVAALGKQVVADFGKVEILVNNAGVTRDGLVLRMTDEDWNTVIDTNLKGAFNTVKAFQRTLLRQKHGRIINVASVIGLIGNAGQANYAASKAGLIGLTKSLAREFAGREVTANAIAPGFISTDMTGALSEEQRKAIQDRVPLGSLGTVEDVAAAALYLASEQARYVTGQVLVVDGGMVM
ncbi:MAG TPA: 3-oxoacyl-[acyl-carrier-protein] reductase [Verrucomicrobiales bacterium]|jgi:3-oxoacyl-[acyl-carrier protein] reductase|nr:3-oxoacyl-[acyl-carrier-protein] reductase [Verrucomicrobiales bacterium]